MAGGKKNGGRDGETLAVPVKELLGNLASPEAAGDELARVELPKEWEIVLDVLEGPLAGRSFPVHRSRVLIGRSVDVSLEDPRVSRRHASLEVYGSTCVLLKDLGSTNGTFVNGRRVQTVELQDGDRILLGGTTLGITIGTPP